MFYLKCHFSYDGKVITPKVIKSLVSHDPLEIILIC